MGYKSKKYKRDLSQQVYDRLTKMLHAGENTSKKEAIADGTYRAKVFSYDSYHTYAKHCRYFSKYVREHYPEVTSLKQAKKYVNEWLQSRVDYTDQNGRHLSAWTIALEKNALSKLYDIRPDDPDYFRVPPRRREDIVRSRVDVVRDKHFSKTNNAELISFCRGVGARRQGISSLRGKDLMTRDQIDKAVASLEQKSHERELSPREQGHLNILRDAQLFDKSEYFVYLKEKGGRERISPIVGPNIDQIVERFRNTPRDEKVWMHVNSNADIHSYRSDYANFVYAQNCRRIDSIPMDRVNKGTGKKYQSEVYVCRKDEAGKKLDRRALFLTSKALGHNRVSVVANNYLRGL